MNETCAKPQPLKIVFAGTPELSHDILLEILSHGFNVELVLTQPDRPSGRGQRLAASPVKELAITKNISVLQPISIKSSPEVIAQLTELKPDLMIVVAYGLILPHEILAIPRLGCINIHVSLLPRHRGAAPIQRAILAGDTETGITIIQMNAGLDTGDILMMESLSIGPNETSGELYVRQTSLSQKMIIEYLNNHQHITPLPQPEIGATYAHKILKSEAEINWHNSALQIFNQIRAFNPAPGCFSYLDNKLVKMWRASLSNQVTSAQPGTIIDANQNSITIACGGKSSINITEIQDAGKARQTAQQYFQSHPNLINSILKTL